MKILQSLKRELQTDSSQTQKSLENNALKVQIEDGKTKGTLHAVKPGKLSVDTWLVMYRIFMKIKCNSIVQ